MTSKQADVKGFDEEDEKIADLSFEDELCLINKSDIWTIRLTPEVVYNCSARIILHMLLCKRIMDGQTQNGKNEKVIDLTAGYLSREHLCKWLPILVTFYNTFYTEFSVDHKGKESKTNPLSASSSSEADIKPIRGAHGPRIKSATHKIDDGKQAITIDFTSDEDDDDDENRDVNSDHEYDNKNKGENEPKAQSVIDNILSINGDQYGYLVLVCNYLNLDRRSIANQLLSKRLIKNIVLPLDSNLVNTTKEYFLVCLNQHVDQKDFADKFSALLNYNMTYWNQVYGLREEQDNFFENKKILNAFNDLISFYPFLTSCERFISYSKQIIDFYIEKAQNTSDVIKNLYQLSGNNNNGVWHPRRPVYKVIYKVKYEARSNLPYQMIHLRRHKPFIIFNEMIAQFRDKLMKHKQGLEVYTLCVKL
jgi:hypothetical protein